MITFCITELPSGPEETIRIAGAYGFGAELVWDSLTRDLRPGIKALAQELGVPLSVHTPVWALLGNGGRVVGAIKGAVKRARGIGATDVVFHSASQSDREPDEVLRAVVADLRRAGAPFDGVNCRVETTGKKALFGSLDQVMDVAEYGVALPCIDFAHLHARDGGVLKTHADVTRVFVRANAHLALLHAHVSGVEYTETGGERRHVPFDESDFSVLSLARCLVDFHAEGRVVVETPNTIEGALQLRSLYELVVPARCPLCAGELTVPDGLEGAFRCSACGKYGTWPELKAQASVSGGRDWYGRSND